MCDTEKARMRKERKKEKREVESGRVREGKGREGGESQREIGEKERVLHGSLLSVRFNSRSQKGSTTSKARFSTVGFSIS